MANFRIIPGQFVRCTEDIGYLKKGEVYQIVSIPKFGKTVTFIGVKGHYSLNLCGCFMEPLEKEEYFEYKVEKSTKSNSI